MWRLARQSFCFIALDVTFCRVVNLTICWRYRIGLKNINYNTFSLYITFLVRARKSSFFFKQKTAYEIASCLVGSEMCIRDRTCNFYFYFYFFFYRNTRKVVIQLMYSMRRLQKLKNYHSQNFKNIVPVSYTHLTLPTKA